MEWAFLKKFPWFGYGLGVVLLGNKVSCIFFKKNFLQFVADFNHNKLCFDFFLNFSAICVSSYLQQIIF